MGEWHSERWGTLRRNDAEPGSLAAYASDAIILVDEGGAIRFWSTAAARMFGWTAEETLGRGMHSVLAPWWGRADYQGAFASLAAMGAGPAIGQVIRVLALRRDGTEFPVELSLTTIKLAGQPCAVGIIRDITSYRRVKAELRLAQEAAEAANQAKSEFLANMSHEIRTPMTAILGYAEILRAENLSQAERLDAIRTITSNGESLLRILTDILDLSEIEAGSAAIECAHCSPGRVVAEVEALLNVRAAGRGLRLEIEYEGAVPETIQTDPVRLRQILVNLVGNAIKFTELGGVRLITRLAAPNTGAPFLQFDVVDTGPGMTAEQAARLFTPFSQANTSSTRTHGGAGLGLAVSKRLANALGGDVCLVETRPGHGSRFRVAVNTGPLDGVKLLDDPRAALAAAATATLAVPGDDAPLHLSGRILLAEDGPDNQRLIAHVLEKAGAAVTVVENGQLAVDAALAARAAARPFHVILMDMQMPIMDGYTATQSLRKVGYTQPILALTAHALAEDRQKCLDAGCDDYASKPIQRQALLRQVGKWTLRAECDANPQPVARA
jgi:PAS domain S-box-containing protein